MFFRLHKFAMLLLLSRKAAAFDPFEGTLLASQCLRCRNVTGCNGTFLEAYGKSESSKTDQNINPADTKFYLFTRHNREHPECLHDCGGRLPNDTLYNPKHKTLIIVGGHLSSVCGFSYFRDMKTQLLARCCYNVILVDWYWGNGADIYVSMHNTKVVGKQIALVIENIMNQTGITGDKIHIIGHAYGAHAAGISGQHVKSSKLRRITGLDPFGGMFIIAPEDQRLDPTDAKLVDVIHTGAGDCFPFALGTTLKCGHADFYPNGGSYQPKCIIEAFHSYLKGDVTVATLSLYPAACYLFQSVRYFLASINACHCQFVGVNCDNYKDFDSGKCRSCGEDGLNCGVMGMDFENYPHMEGNYSYYLKTHHECPYCDNSGIKLQGFPKYQRKECNTTLHCFIPKTHA